MIDRRLFENIDWFLLGLLLFNSLVGVAFIYSSSHYLPGNYYLRQLAWIAVGLLTLFLFLTVDYKILLAYSYYAYGLVILVLFGMLFLARGIAGAKSWIRLSSFQAQPSEVAKIVLILVLAKLFSRDKGMLLSTRDMLTSAALVGVPFFLVACQPDLGTAICFLPLLLAAWVLAGLKRKALIWITIFLCLAGGASWRFYLKEYQKRRVTSVVFPGRDPRGAGYQTLQSRIALGSGGFLGKGYKKGTQSQLRFLPARHTDFIFSVIGEELGFVGAAVVLLLCFSLLRRVFSSVEKSRDRPGIYIIFLVGAMLTFQTFVNIAMVVGVFPIIGIPLPLLSYGGSSLLANYIGVALVLNVKMRRFANI